MARASTIALAALLFASTHAAAVAQSVGGAGGEQAATQPYYYQDPGQYATGEGGGYAVEYVEGEFAEGDYDPANVFQGEDGQYYYYEYVDEGEAVDGEYAEYVEEYPAGEEGAADYATEQYDPANVFQGPDGQYYYYEYEDVPAGEETYDAAAEQGEYAYPANAMYLAPQYNTPANTINYLVPGADWSHNSQAVFQPDDEVPALPGEEEIDISPPGVDTDEPTFGTEQEQTYQAVMEAAPLQFLRAQSVLLDKGERQVDVGFQYAITEGVALIPQVVGVAPNQDQVISSIRVRQRVMLTPIELRYGLTDELQAFVSVPLGFNNSEISYPGFDHFSTVGGLGDVSAGLSKVVVEGCGYGPDVILTVAMTAPTGPAGIPVTPTIPNATLGQGYWAAQASLLFIQVMDPLVVFYGAGFNHRFDATFNNVLGSFHVDPGEIFIYQFGVGFGVNESVSLSTSFLGQYITEDEINDIRVYGGILEPMRLRFAATFANPCKIVEPFAEIGMTRDATAARIGLTITY